MAIDQDIQEQIAELYSRGTKKVPAILKSLAADPKFTGRELPGERAVYRHLEGVRPALDKEAEQGLDMPWRLTRVLCEGISRDDLGFLLEIVYLLNSTAQPPMTVRTAQWVCSVRHTMESFEPLQVHEMAADYSRLERWALIHNDQMDGNHQDLYLAYRPWASDERDAQYLKGIKEGRIPPRVVTARVYGELRLEGHVEAKIIRAEGPVEEPHGQDDDSRGKG